MTSDSPSGLSTGLGCVMSAIYLAAGLIQFLAAVAGLQLWVNWLPSLLAYVAAIFLAYVPIVGSAFAYYGAAYAWHWEWYWALALVAPQLIFLLIAPLALMAAGLIERRRLGQ